MADPRWLTEARQFIGTTEIHGPQTNQQIAKWWTLIRAPFTDDETPWCAGFVGGVLESVGIKSSRSAAARSYLRWGVELEKPAPGCIVVFERGPRNGHVGFFVGYRPDGALLILGGNQGDAVNVKPFSPSRVLGYRWPADEPLPAKGRRTVIKDESDAPLSRGESLMSMPEDEEPTESLLVKKIRSYGLALGGVFSSLGAFLSNLFDWRVAAVFAGVGLVIFLVIWFIPRRR